MNSTPLKNLEEKSLLKETEDVNKDWSQDATDEAADSDASIQDETPHPRKGPGRSKLNKTGKPGRPRKLFHMKSIQDESPDEPNNFQETMEGPNRDL